MHGIAEATKSFLRRCRIGRAVPLLLAIGLSGCTYVCHRYVTTEPLTANSGWRLYGYVYRSRGPSSPHPAGGGWPHWGSAKDDEYYLVLTPVLNDSSLWNWFAADAVDPVVRVPGYEQYLKWAKVEDVQLELRGPWPESGGSGKDSSPILVFPRATTLPRREHGPREFKSEKFRLPYPPPDSLEIRVELQLRNAQSGAILKRIPARAWAIIDRHRRWTIIDMVES